jgi:hypothetical protein
LNRFRFLSKCTILIVSWCWFNCCSVFSNSQILDVDNFRIWRAWMSISEMLSVSAIFVFWTNNAFFPLWILSVKFKVVITNWMFSVHTQ